MSYLLTAIRSYIHTDWQTMLASNKSSRLDQLDCLNRTFLDDTGSSMLSFISNHLITLWLGRLPSPRLLNLGPVQFNCKSAKRDVDEAVLLSYDGRLLDAPNK